MAVVRVVVVGQGGSLFLFPTSNEEEVQNVTASTLRVPAGRVTLARIEELSADGKRVRWREGARARGEDGARAREVHQRVEAVLHPRGDRWELAHATEEGAPTMRFMGVRGLIDNSLSRSAARRLRALRQSGEGGGARPSSELHLVFDVEVDEMGVADVVGRAKQLEGDGRLARLMGLAEDAGVELAKQPVAVYIPILFAPTSTEADEAAEGGTEAEVEVGAGSGTGATGGAMDGWETAVEGTTAAGESGDGTQVVDDGSPADVEEARPRPGGATGSASGAPEGGQEVPSRESSGESIPEDGVAPSTTPAPGATGSTASGPSTPSGAESPAGSDDVVNVPADEPGAAPDAGSGASPALPRDVVSANGTVVYDGHVVERIVRREDDELSSEEHEEALKRMEHMGEENQKLRERLLAAEQEWERRIEEIMNEAQRNRTEAQESTMDLAQTSLLRQLEEQEKAMEQVRSQHEAAQQSQQWARAQWVEERTKLLKKLDDGQAPVQFIEPAHITTRAAERILTVQAARDAVTTLGAVEKKAEKMQVDALVAQKEIDIAMQKSDTVEGIETAYYDFVDKQRAAEEALKRRLELQSQLQILTRKNE